VRTRVVFAVILLLPLIGGLLGRWLSTKRDREVA